LFFVPSIFLSFLSQFLLIAIVAEAVVAADHFAAAFAFPQLILLFEKLFYPVFFDELQIAYQAHSVVGSVSVVDCFQSPTRKAPALETEGDFTFG
jgi:hypothetical protein